MDRIKASIIVRSRETIIGAIFPISAENAVSIFDQKRSVFVKFTNLKKLKKGSKMVFYVSKQKKLVGEGVVLEVEKMKPEIAWIRYGNQIFLDESEYKQYVVKSPISGEDRKMAMITVFLLRKLKKYDKPVECMYNITPAGCYLTQEKYQRILAPIEE